MDELKRMRHYIETLQEIFTITQEMGPSHKQKKLHELLWERTNDLKNIEARLRTLAYEGKISPSGVERMLAKYGQKTDKTLTDEEVCIVQMALEFWIEHCHMCGSWMCDPAKPIDLNNQLTGMMLEAGIALDDFTGPK